MKIEQIFSIISGLQSPWQITEIDFKKREDGTFIFD